MQKTIMERSYPSCPCSSSIKNNCAAVTGHGTNDMNMGVVLLGYQCSHIATDWGSHRVQTRSLHTYLYLLLYEYKDYMIDISTSLDLSQG